MAQEAASRTAVPTEDEAPTPAATAAQVVSTAQAVARDSTGESSAGLDMLMDVELNVTVELGRTRMEIRDILALGVGGIVELGKLVSEPVDVLVNGTPFAEGEVVVVDDAFAVRVTRLLDRSLLPRGNG